jgi:hypothetical protein
LEALS